MELHEPFVESLAMLRDALRHRVVFDPAQSQRCFRVCMTDISQIVLLPRLLNRLKAVAPSIRVDVFPIAADTPKVLEAGDADLAIGFMPQLEAGFYQQKLFEQSFVCMVRNDHPRIGKSLTLKRFVDESHIQITTSGRTLDHRQGIRGKTHSAQGSAAHPELPRHRADRREHRSKTRLSSLA